MLDEKYCQVVLVDLTQQYLLSDVSLLEEI